MLSTDEWTNARQDAIDSVTTLANRVSTDAFTVRESIGACEDHDDLDRSIAQAHYLVQARPVADADSQLEDDIRPRMEADGWSFRDRGTTLNGLQGTTLYYNWFKGDESVSVRLWRPDDIDIISVSAVSPCGKRGDVLSGTVAADAPWYLPPTVEGPTIEDNNPDRVAPED